MKYNNIPEVVQTSNDYLLIDSGFIVTFNNHSDIEFAVNFDEGKFKMHFSFEDDNGKEQNIETTSDEDTVYVKCKNFKHSQGTGTKELLQLGKHKDKYVYIGFWIYSLGTLKKIEYCFFIEQ